MKIIKILIFTLSITSTVFSAEPDEKLHNQCLYPTVLIATNDGSSGTGTIIRSDKIAENEYHNIVLTCNHLISPDPKVLYRVYRGQYKNWSDLEKTIFYPAVVYDKNSSIDVAIMCFISTTKMPVATLGTDVKSYVGNDIFKIGCGGEEPFRLDYGKITMFNVNRSPGNTSINGLTRHNAYTLPGDSGGPIFQEYKLIGITNSIKIISNPIDPEGQMLLEHIAFFVPLKKIEEWNKQEHTIDFIFNSAKEMPKVDFAILNLMNYSVSN